MPSDSSSYFIGLEQPECQIAFLPNAYEQGEKFLWNYWEFFAERP
jgi:hypothetical protein